MAAEVTEAMSVDTSKTELILDTCSDEDIAKHTRELAARVDELEKPLTIYAAQAALTAARMREAMRAQEQ